MVSKCTRCATCLIRASGLDKPTRLIITSAIFAVTSFFYIYTVGSHFDLPIYSFQDRVTHFTYFDLYVINRSLDHIILIAGTVLWSLIIISSKLKYFISASYGLLTFLAFVIFSNLEIILDISALMSLPFMIFFLIYNRFKSKSIVLRTGTHLTVKYLAIMAFTIGILSIIESVSLLFFPVSPLPLRNYENELFVLLTSNLSAVLISLLIICFPLRLLINELRKKILDVRVDPDANKIPYGKIKLKYRTICLVFFILLSVILVILPHQPQINVHDQQISRDTDYYLEWLKPLLKSNSLQEFITQAFVTINAGDRPFALMLLFAIVQVMPFSPFYTIDYIIPMILAPLLVLAVYFLTREITSDDFISLLSSFLTAISFHTLIGIYAGFYANWMALTIGCISFIFLMKYLKNLRKLNFIIYSVFMTVLYFTHIYTWTILAVTIGIFLIVIFINNYFSRKSIVFLLLIILGGIIIDSTKAAFTDTSSGIGKDIENINLGRFGLDQFSLRWSNLIYTSHVYVGGLFGNFVIFALGLLWLFYSRLNEWSNIFIIILLSVGLLPLFFGNEIIQARTFYNILFQIPSAVGLAYIKRYCNEKMIFVAVCVWLVAISITAVVNFAPNVSSI